MGVIVAARAWHNGSRCLDNEIFTRAIVLATMRRTMPHVRARRRGRAGDLSHIAVSRTRFPCMKNAQVGFRRSLRLSPVLNTKHTCRALIR